MCTRFEAVVGSATRDKGGGVPVVRVINGRRAQEERLAYLSRSTISPGVNEAYGFDVADELISAKRLRAKMRGGDAVGRDSGNKFGVIKTCTPDEIAAERLLAGVRDDVAQTETRAARWRSRSAASTRRAVRVRARA